MLDLNAQYEIMSFAIGDTKAGSKMGKMQLKNLDNSATLNCILWEETLNRIKEISTRVGNIIKITSATYSEKYNNCLISNFEVINQASLGLDEETRLDYFNKIIDVIKSFSDEKLKDFLLNVLNENKERFLISPAAKQMHHNYIGGLVLHTFECLEMAQVVLSKTKKYLNKQEVFAACVLHDIGKIFEYDINVESGVIEYNEQFRKDWLSHSQYGYSLCMAAGFLNIAKMIASHHGRADWGAMIDLGEKDLEPFYYIIHHIDDLSAKFGATSVNDVDCLKK